RTGLRHQAPAFLRSNAYDIRLRNRRQMQLRRVLDKERKRHEGEHCIGTAELRKAALLGRIIDGGEASLRPGCGRDGRFRELIDEGLSVASSSRISGSAEH